MAHSYLEGREENKETEPPEAAEMHRGHRPWAHTHRCRQGPSPVRAHSIFPPVSPQDRAGSAGCQAHPSTSGFSTSGFRCQMLLGQSWASLQHSGRRWKWNLDEFPPSAAKRDGTRTTAGRAPPTAPTHCGLPDRGFSFFR